MKKFPVILVLLPVFLFALPAQALTVSATAPDGSVKHIQIPDRLNSAGYVLGSFTNAEAPSKESQIVFIKNQIAGLMKEMLALLQSQMAAAIKAQGN